MPEVRETDGEFRSLDTASLALPLYPWMDVAPDGRAFYSGPTTTMRSLEPRRLGLMADVRPARLRVPRLRQSRALRHRQDPRRRAAGSSTRERDGHRSERRDADRHRRRGDGDRAPAAQPHGARRRHGAGHRRALVRRARRRFGRRRLPRRALESRTGQWRTLAAMQVTRQYHSTALLLPDGRVLSAGGGVCGPCDAGRLPGEERRGVLSAIPVQGRRLGRARPAASDHLRASRDGVRRSNPASPRPTPARSARSRWCGWAPSRTR